MSRRGVRLVGVAAVAAASAWLLVAPASEGAVASASGWWSTAGASPVPIDGSATGATPGPGQLGVSATPAGASSVAAVRFGLDPGETPTSLTLTIASGQGQQVAVVVVCPAGSPWTAASGGPADQAPKAACDRAIAGTKPTADGKLTFALSPAFVISPGVLDLVIAPGTTDVNGTAVTPAFSLVLAAPTATDLATQQTADPSGSFSFPADAGSTSSPPASGASSPSFEPSVAAPSDVPAPDGAVLSPEPAADAAIPAAAPVFAPAPGVPLARVRRAASTSDDRAQRFGLVLFPLAFLGAVWALNTSSPGLRGIGRLAHASTADTATGPVTAGLSRFRRDRTAPPVPLR